MVLNTDPIRKAFLPPKRWVKITPVSSQGNKKRRKI
jgi:hypothetical protein